MERLPNKNYLEKAIKILEFARERVVKSVNQTMVFAYYEIGKIIVEEEQEGNEKAEYAKKQLKTCQENCLKNMEEGFL